MKSRILVIDDETSICDMLKKFLEKREYEVFTANNGPAGVEMVRKMRVDAVICDIKMPGMTGLHVTDEIKKFDQRIPVLIITAYPTMDTAIEALKAGAHDYMVKPVHLEEIAAKVDRALTNRRLLEENVLFSKIVSLHEVTRSIASVHDFTQLTHMVLEYSMRISKSDAGILMLLNDCGELKVHASIGDREELFFRPADGLTIANWVILNEEPLLIDESQGAIERLGEIDRRGVGSSITFPLRTVKRLIGILQLNRARRAPGFSNVDLEIVNVLASQASISIDNVEVYNKMQEQYLQMMRAFASAVEAKDAYTRGHSEKVMEYSIKLGGKMGLSHDELEVVKYAGLLHDIGKIGVPEQILNKPGRLTPAEYSEIKKHPEAGMNIVSDVASIKPLVPLIHYHHEQFDGNGYPDGISREEIPQGARILAITDAFDAMTSSRSYRKAMPKGKALDVIRKELGRQFDPHIGDLFIEMMDKEDV